MVAPPLTAASAMSTTLRPPARPRSVTRQSRRLATSKAIQRALQPARHVRRRDRVERVDEGDAETAGPRRLGRGDFAGDPVDADRRGRRDQGVGLDRGEAGDDRRQGATERRDLGHQRRAVGDLDHALAVGDQIDRAGGGDDAALMAGQGDRRGAGGVDAVGAVDALRPRPPPRSSRRRARWP